MATSSITNNFVVDRVTYNKILAELKNIPPRKVKDAEKLKPYERSREILKQYPFR